jgi:death-on-curing protein
MITVKKAISTHEILIEESGGSAGVRDLGGLEAAIARPYATFDQQDLYATPIDKAAAILESLIINHPFVDGNKRIAYVLMRSILLEYDIKLSADENERYKFVIAASMGEIRFEEIKTWLEANTTPTK